MADPTVCRLLPQDWQAYRAIRLAMLQESPLSFGSKHAQAASFDEQLWRQRLADNAVMLAVVGTSPAGSAMYSEFGMTDRDDCALNGMWVDPRFRGTGVGRVLVDAVVAQARAAGKRRVVLRVVNDNTPAAGLYERAGFVPTGRTLPYPHDEKVLEVEMALVLEDGLSL
ncbi:MAG: GNAT family N-acetyltransferase [Chloroflexota bacterium]|nr:GNAT family N-acetyltransferase [Chloroflexota bacterium]